MSSVVNYFMILARVAKPLAADVTNLRDREAQEIRSCCCIVEVVAMRRFSSSAILCDKMKRKVKRKVRRERLSRDSRLAGTTASIYFMHICRLQHCAIYCIICASN